MEPTTSRQESPISWEMPPKKDFDLLTRWEYIAILQATLLIDYDGTSDFIARRLNLPKSGVASMMEFLCDRGYLKKRDGVLKISSSFYEFQSQSSKEQIRKYHKSVLMKAKETLETQTDSLDLDLRLITSATITCSRKNVDRFKIKIAGFLKELSEESALDNPDELYQFAIQFFPITHTNNK